MHQDDRNTLNPAGAARRRLLKAAGLGAVAAGLSLDWQTPHVRLGALPAHAESTTEGCDVTVALTVAANSGFSVVGYYGDSSHTTFGATLSPGGEPVTLGTTYSQPANTTYSAGVSRTGTDGISYSATFEATCCTAIESGVGFNSQSQLLALASQTGDTGTCSFLD